MRGGGHPVFWAPTHDPTGSTPSTARCLHTRADTHTENVLGAPLRSCYSVTHWVFTQVTSPAPRRVQQLTWAP